MRRTKEDSEQTRLQILAAARQVFARNGVTRTTMEHIAQAAGVTRGAIYWHFANKIQLFNAMRDQVSLPLIDKGDDELLSADTHDPLEPIERFLHGIVDAVASDKDTRQTFQIMSFKCEYVDELERELKQYSARCHELLDKLAPIYERARREGVLRPDLEPRLAALDTCLFISGLMRHWLLDERGAFVRKHVDELIAAHVGSRRQAAATTRPRRRQPS